MDELFYCLFLENILFKDIETTKLTTAPRLAITAVKIISFMLILKKAENIVPPKTPDFMF